LPIYLPPVEKNVKDIAKSLSFDEAVQIVQLETGMSKALSEVAARLIFDEIANSSGDQK